MVGSVGQFLILFGFLISSVITGLYLLAYAARCILVVVQGTAGGSDRVVWPDEPIMDWATGALGLVGLVLLWLIPIGFLSRALEEVLFPGRSVARLLVLAGPLLWLYFPLGALSSLSSVSPWAFFRPVIAWRMLVLFPATAMFYLTSALVVGLGVLLLYLSIFLLPFLLLLSGPVGAAFLLIYARMLGRLAWRIRQLGPLLVKEPAKPRRPAPARPRHPRPQSRAKDPWNIPTGEPETVVAPGPHRSPTGILDEENADPYGVADPSQTAEPSEQDPPARQRPLDPEEEEVRQGYGMSAESKTETVSRERPQRGKLRRKKERRPAKPPGTAFAGVLGFPWYETSMAAWVWLSLGTVVLGFLLVGLRQVMPALEG